MSGSAVGKAVAAALRHPTASDDKYRRGVLGVRTGSAHYPGAAVLSVSAAWRTGVGLLRFVPQIDDAVPPYGLPTPAAAVLTARPETVFGLGSRPCDAWLIGSGTDPATRSMDETSAITAFMEAEAPMVVDAGALELVTKMVSSFDRGTASLAPMILTPHAGEFARLWDASGLGARPNAFDDPEAFEARSEAAARLASALGATVLLKGSRTVCATPGGLRRHAPAATPWLATAGTGDVLAGILAALVTHHHATVRAEPEFLADLGIAAATLHDRAARVAAGTTSSGSPIVALDIVDAIPAAWKELAIAQATP